MGEAPCRVERHECGHAMTARSEPIKGFLGYTGRQLDCACGATLEVRHEPRPAYTDRDPEIVAAGWTRRESRWRCADCGEREGDRGD